MAVNLAGEVEQPDIEVLYLDASGIDFSQSVFHARDRLFSLRLPARHVDHVDQKASLQKDPVREFLEFSVDGFDQLFAVDCGAQQGFQHRQERLGFFKGESSFGHKVWVYFSPFLDVVGR